MNKVNKLESISPLFLKHQEDFEKNPRSRVFAPLAESYRKMGMLDKAMDILSEGIRHHPSYVMGYLGLAFCYFDLKNFKLAYTTLLPLKEANRDNIRLQRLFADTCIKLSLKEEALETLKYLLFLNPKDKEVGSIVKKIENEMGFSNVKIENEKNNLNFEYSNLFKIESLINKNEKSNEDVDDWKFIDLNPIHENLEKNFENEINNWNQVVSSEENITQIFEPKKIESREEEKIVPAITEVKEEQELDREYIVNMVENEKEVSLVLVDLYLGQGFFDKALELLEKMHLLNPNAQNIIDKIYELKNLNFENKDEK